MKPCDHSNPTIAQSVVQLLIDASFIIDSAGVARVNPAALIDVASLIGWDHRTLGRLVEAELERDIAQEALDRLGQLFPQHLNDRHDLNFCAANAA